MTLPSPPPDPAPIRDPAHIERALAAFGLTLQQPPRLGAESVLNENYEVDTDAGPRFLRFVREDRTEQRVLLEQALTSHAAAAGIPVVRPTVIDGAPFIRLGGELVQLYPWVEGRHGGLTDADAQAMGEMHARLHSALVAFDHPDLRRRVSGVAWDTERSIAVLSRIDDLIRYYPSPPPESLRVQERLRLQLALLESPEARPAADFADLPQQACHGDYHNRNVLFERDGGIVAVLDWEVANLMSPAYEVVRALCFSGYLEQPFLDAYLAGYVSRGHLSGADCERGIEMWWQSRIHSHWALERRFIHGDRRVERFFDEEEALLLRFADPTYRARLADQLQS
ncbi:MAG: phosphotransferase enzyme family protein, partial [Tepidiformaceae bacterium]